jgi:hypothetical protein
VAELEQTNEQLVAENAQTKAESQALADALTTMAHEHVREGRAYSGSQGPVPPPPVDTATEDEKDRSFDLFDRTRSSEAVSSPLAKSFSENTREIEHARMELERSEGRESGLREEVEELRSTKESLEAELEKSKRKIATWQMVMDEAGGQGQGQGQDEAGGGSSIEPEKLNQLKSMTSDLQSMINEEIEQLEQELQDAEGSLAVSNKELQGAREELLAEKQRSYEVEKDLRKDLSAARKQIEMSNEREERAAESVEKRRSSRGNFWSPSQRLSQGAGEAGGEGGAEEFFSPVGGGGGDVESLRSELQVSAPTPKEHIQGREGGGTCATARDSACFCRRRAGIAAEPSSSSEPKDAISALFFLLASIALASLALAQRRIAAALSSSCSLASLAG